MIAQIEHNFYYHVNLQFMLDHSAGPPLSPAPFVEAVNTTFLQISWEEPFAWEGYTVDSYFITIEIASSGDIIDRTLNDTAIIFHRERIAMTCANLVFNVSAESVLGRSEPGTVTSGFPIGEYAIIHVCNRHSNFIIII